LVGPVVALLFGLHHLQLLFSWEHAAFSPPLGRVWKCCNVYTTPFSCPQCALCVPTAARSTTIIPQCRALERSCTYSSRPVERHNDW